MNDLDRLENFSQIDTTNLFKNIQELPFQCEKAWEDVKKVVFPSYYVRANKIIILGIGGSAIGGDLVREFIEKKVSIPVMVFRDYNLPGCIDRDTLVICCSYSGITEEPMTAFEKEAIPKKAKLAGITTGGRLEELSKIYKFPLYKFDYPTEPRQALGFLFTAILGILNKIAIVDVKEDEFKEAVLLMKSLSAKIDPKVKTKTNHAKKLAIQLYNKIVIAMAGGYLRPVARRFKTQLNENSKHMAFWEELPETCHNFIIGLEYPSKLSDEVFVLSLVSKYDHQRVKLRQNTITEILNKNKIPNEELRIEPSTSILSEMLSFVLLLDYTSFYLAMLNDVDPRPIENIKLLKQKLAETPWKR